MVSKDQLEFRIEFLHFLLEQVGLQRAVKLSDKSVGRAQSESGGDGPTERKLESS